MAIQWNTARLPKGVDSMHTTGMDSEHALSERSQPEHHRPRGPTCRKGPCGQTERD
jgi:hypothetical protein